MAEAHLRCTGVPGTPTSGSGGPSASLLLCYSSSSGWELVRSGGKRWACSEKLPCLIQHKKQNYPRITRITRMGAPYNLLRSYEDICAPIRVIRVIRG